MAHEHDQSEASAHPLLPFDPEEVSFTYEQYQLITTMLGSEKWPVINRLVGAYGWKTTIQLICSIEADYDMAQRDAEDVSFPDEIEEYWTGMAELLLDHPPAQPAWREIASDTNGPPGGLKMVEDKDRSA
jgi:hypothetical protein